jgi:hypothetical protein
MSALLERIRKAIAPKRNAEHCDTTSPVMGVERRRQVPKPDTREGAVEEYVRTRQARSRL